MKKILFEGVSLCPFQEKYRSFEIIEDKRYDELQLF